MPGSTPATSQLDWLISTTAMIVLSWSKATRDLLKACPGEGRGGSAGASGHSISWLQRRWCHFLAACPIPSLRWRKADSNHRSRSEKSGRSETRASASCIAQPTGAAANDIGADDRQAAWRSDHSNTATASELQVRPVG